MFKSRYTSNRSPSISSQQNLSKSPNPSDYEYLGRLVTRERPIVRSSKSTHRNLVLPSNIDKYEHSSASDRQNIYEDIRVQSSGDDDDDDNGDGVNRPLGIIRISDRHFREIYRLPTPPPKVKRVYHRLRSPEPKIIERVYVRRPAPQIIENIIEVPPEKVKIIKREKFLENSKPITRSKLVHLKSNDDHQGEYAYETEQRNTFVPVDPSNQQPTTTAPGSTTALVYPPQPNARTIGYIKSTVPPHIMLKSQQSLLNQTTQPALLNPSSTQQTTTLQMVQPTAAAAAASTLNPSSQQTTTFQMMQPAATPFNPLSQQTTTFQMMQPAASIATPQATNYQLLQQTPAYNPSVGTAQTTTYQLLQPSSYPSLPTQTTSTYPMFQTTSYGQPLQQPTPYVYPTAPNIYGYRKY